ncbi:Uncharacterised protein [Mycobacterium tuberculosis]|nr:Uncharacterised protein [Mycobacterium tuberculosis]
MLRLPDRAMTADEVEADLARAVDERMAARIEQARERRAARQQDRAAKLARRTAGLRQRHRRILARRTEQTPEVTTDGS